MVTGLYSHSCFRWDKFHHQMGCVDTTAPIAFNVPRPRIALYAEGASTTRKSIIAEDRAELDP
jgi:hypothetical protein